MTDTSCIFHIRTFCWDYLANNFMASSGIVPNGCTACHNCLYANDDTNIHIRHLKQYTEFVYDTCNVHTSYLSIVYIRCTNTETYIMKLVLGRGKGHGGAIGPRGADRVAEGEGRQGAEYSELLNTKQHWRTKNGALTNTNGTLTRPKESFK